MTKLKESPATAQAEQATVYATGMESDNNGMKPQGSVTPDSNGGTNSNVNKDERKNCILYGDNMGTENNTYYFPTVEELLERIPTGVKYQKYLPYTDIDYATYGWSITHGCSKQSEGCEHCYASFIAENQSKRSDTKHFMDGFKPKFDEDMLYVPLLDSRKGIVFVSPLGDLAHPDITDEQRRKVIEIIQADTQKMYLILTKRPEILVRLFKDVPVPSNCLLGVSVESEKFLFRMDILRQISSENLVVSFAPLIGSVRSINFKKYTWVLIEGEATRPMKDARVVKIDWICSIIEQAKAASIPPAIYVKQLGNNVDGIVKSKATHGYLVEGVSYRQYPNLVKTFFGKNNEELEMMNASHKKVKIKAKKAEDSPTETLLSVVPFSKVIETGLKKGKVNNLYGEWVVENEVTVVAGDTNAGKSTLTYQIGMDIASGCNTLGFSSTPNTDTGAVIYVETEMNSRQLSKRYGNIEISTNMLFVDAVGMELEQMVEQITKIVEEKYRKKKSTIIIIDSITIAANGSITAKVAKKLMNRLKALCELFYATVVILVHTRKRDKSKPVEMQDLAGSAKLTDMADNVLAVAKCGSAGNEVYVKLLKTRSNAYPSTVRLYELSDAKYLHFDFIQECKEQDLLTSAASGKIELTPELELKIVTRHEEGASIRTIASETGLSKSTVDRIIQKQKDNQELKKEPRLSADTSDTAA